MLHRLNIGNKNNNKIYGMEKWKNYVTVTAMNVKLL